MTILSEIYRHNPPAITTQTQIKCTRSDHNYLLNTFNWLTWAFRTVPPVLGLANNTLLSLVILLITSGSDHLSNSLAVTFWAFELTRFFLYITVSPTLHGVCVPGCICWRLYGKLTLNFGRHVSKAKYHLQTWRHLATRVSPNGSPGGIWSLSQETINRQ